MITNAVLGALLSVSGWLVGLFPDAELPGWLAEIPTQVAAVGQYLGGTAAWFPWNTVGLAVASVLVACGVGLVLKLVRIVASFLTLGGGSAA
jgi:hypothetical protein